MNYIRAMVASTSWILRLQIIVADDFLCKQIDVEHENGSGSHTRNESVSLQMGNQCLEVS